MSEGTTPEVAARRIRRRMARKLREMRSTTQLGQRDFAVEAGVACSTISRAESGTVWPTPATIAAYERITGLTWAV